MKTRHHYLPRMYLEGFCNSRGFIYTYDKIQDNSWKTVPEKAGLEGKLYHLENAIDINMIENYFAGNVEAHSASALKNLQQEKFPEINDREKLCLFF